MLRLTLEELGHTVVEAPDGRAALVPGLASSADIVLVDIFMPEREGLETINGLRSSNPALRIVAMTGGGRHGAYDLLDVATGLGATRALKKPFSRAELIRALTD
jgi:CheY-like chemotaxis protein